MYCNVIVLLLLYQELRNETCKNRMPVCEGNHWKLYLDVMQIFKLQFNLSKSFTLATVKYFLTSIAFLNVHSFLYDLTTFYLSGKLTLNFTTKLWSCKTSSLKKALKAANYIKIFAIQWCQQFLSKYCIQISNKNIILNTSIHILIELPYPFLCLLGKVE